MSIMTAGLIAFWFAARYLPVFTHEEPTKAAGEKERKPVYA
jgi:hypothetical protein